MQLYHIVAVAENGVIGLNNQLPWPRFSADMRHFKAATLGGTLVMGRRTFESLGSRPLPQRENFVLSRSHLPGRDATLPHLWFFNSLEEALGNAPTEKVFIIGGAEIFRETIERVDGILLTEIEHDYEGDTYYPDIPDYFHVKSAAPLHSGPGEPSMEVIEYVNTRKVKSESFQNGKRP